MSQEGHEVTQGEGEGGSGGGSRDKDRAVNAGGRAGLDSKSNSTLTNPQLQGAPKYILKAYKYLYDACKDPRWQLLLESWLSFKCAGGFPEPNGRVS